MLPSIRRGPQLILLALVNDLIFIISVLFILISLHVVWEENVLVLSQMFEVSNKVVLITTSPVEGVTYIPVLPIIELTPPVSSQLHPPNPFAVITCLFPPVLLLSFALVNDLIFVISLLDK